MYPSIAEVLELPVLRAGRPVVRAGRSALATRLRWVHVSELREPAGMLSGGELVLSIGAAAADPATEPRGYVEALREAGAIGLVIELGQHLRTLPESLVQAARERGFPLVELRATVRFVEVTEAVHTLILNEQYLRLEFTQRVTETFRTLMVEGAEVDTVVATASALLGLPVVLEDLGHRALAFDGDDPADLLRDWTRRSRQAAPSGPEGWSSVPVGPRTERWGRLVVPRRPADPDRAELVLSQAADAVSVLTAAGRNHAGHVDADGGLLADLRSGVPLPDGAVAARARALGLAADGPFAVIVVATAAPAGTRAVVDAARAALRRLPAPGLVGALGAGRVGVVLGCPAPAGEPGLVDRFAALLAGAPVRAVAAAGPAPDLDGLADALGDALHAADVADSAADPAEHVVWRPRDLGLRGLVRRLRDDRHLLAYVDEQLGPVLRLSEPRRTAQLTTLRAYAAAGGNMSDFAARLGISRPAAYDRLRRLSQLLGRDLRSPAAGTAVHVAVLAHDQIGAADQGQRGSASATVRRTGP